MQSQRAPVIDALRGLALFGILAVNIQSAVWSVGGPTLGVLDATSRTADYVAVVLTAFFLEYKFYPIFCFCFGYGFAVQVSGWKRRAEDASARWQRRMGFMLVMGLLHGIFVWFGDILARYALTGMVLRRHMDRGPRALLKAARFWFVVVLAVTFVYALIPAPDDVSTTLPAEITAAKAIYENGSYWQVTWQRSKDFFLILTTYLFVFPQVMLLFLLGALTAKMGWLAHPARHRAWLLKVFVLALLAGVPINIVYAIDGVTRASDFSAVFGFRAAFVSTAAPIFSFAIIAGSALLSTHHFGARIAALFAPAGKLALTNYIAQSMLMSTLLYGYGFGLGRQFKQAELLALALAIFFVQLVFSHIYLRYFKQGPLEWLWRRWTNGNDANSATSSREIRDVSK
jgi:uncharacterized protein